MNDTAGAPAPKPTMLQSLANWRMVVCIFTGFSSGMPLFVVYQMVPIWLRDGGVDLKTIGLFSIASLAYTWKFAWSPLLDVVRPPMLGRRRGWALFMQIALALVMASWAALDPQFNITAIAIVYAAVCFFSATQDIVLDAHRREILPDAELGIGNSMFVNAYRLSSLVPGSLALILADHLPWSMVHIIVAAFMAIGIVTTLLMPEPALTETPPRTFEAAVVAPLREFFVRDGVKAAVLVLTFMLLYKIGDSMATALASVFYRDCGYTKTQIGTVVKVVSVSFSIGGGVVGGLAMVKIGINRALWLFGVVQITSILGFAWLAHATFGFNVGVADPINAGLAALGAVVAFEYLGVGLGTAAFVAFIARSTDKRYTATQLALLTSFTALPRTFANASTGFIVEAIGYTQFFIICTLCAVPGMLMLKWVAPWNQKR